MSELVEERTRLEHVLCHRGIFRIAGPLPAYEARPTISLDPLGGRLWTASDGIYRTIFAEGDEGVVAWDTFYSPGAALAYRLALGRLLPLKEVHTVVYSHDHLDHSGFAANLSPGADVVAHEHCARVVEARAADGQTAPTNVWSGERRAFALDGVDFELVYPGPTHGNGNVAALFPEQRLLFMVDTVIPGVGYTFFPDWHFGRYAESMRSLLALPWDRFLPGHFWAVDRREFEANLDWIDVLREAARDALAAGVDPDRYDEVHAWAKGALAAYAHLFRFHEYAGTNLMRLMSHELTGGWGLESVAP